MNIKIGQGGILFKISEEELKTLVAGSGLQEEIQIGLSRFMLSIEKSYEENGITLQAELHVPGLCLTISDENVRKLLNMGKNKEGISFQVTGTQVTLQVDMRKDSRTRT